MAGHVARSERFGRASRMRCAHRSGDVSGEGGRIAGWDFVSMWRRGLGGNCGGSYGTALGWGEFNDASMRRASRAEEADCQERPRPSLRQVTTA